MAQAERKGFRWNRAAGLIVVVVGALAFPTVRDMWLCYSGQPRYIIEAIRNDDLRAIKRYLDRGCALNRPDTSRGPIGPPYYPNGLLTMGAADEFPLSSAACAGRCEIVALLLHRGALVNQRDSHRLTALHYACVGDYRPDATIHLLLDHGAEIDAVGGPSVTPLDLLGMRRPELIGLLLRHGGRINLGRITKKEMNAEFAASMGGSEPPRRALWQDLARTRLADKQATLNELLCKAAAAHCADTMRMLLDMGADANAVSLDGGFSALLLAVDSGVSDYENQGVDSSPKCAQLLIDHGAKARRALDKNGLTALHYACRNHDYALAEILLRAGADPNARSKDGKTPYGMLTPVEDLLR